MNTAPNLTARAKRDVQVILRYIDAKSKRGAAAWYRKLSQVLQSIGDSPASFGFAPENDDHDEESAGSRRIATTLSDLLRIVTASNERLSDFRGQFNTSGDQFPNVSPVRPDLRPFRFGRVQTQRFH